ncbi:MAG: RNA methyltransferase [Verrucomicrobiales bacterium]|nr:RNA methyltransferase [Verrucomicrobiales bacterium]
MLDSVAERFSSPERDQFVVEGRWAVEALLESGKYEVTSILKAEGSYPGFEDRDLHSAELLVAPKQAISQMLGYPFHRGLLALAKRPDSVNSLPRNLTGLFVTCPEIADESNLGAIIRTAAALGASGMVLQKDRGADVYSRKAIRTSSGAVFRFPVYEVADLESEIRQLKKSEFTVLATALRNESVALHEVPLRRNTLVMFGPEKDGLSETWLKLCDTTVEIPMANGMDSLNVAASAAIVLYQLLRRE